MFTTEVYMLCNNIMNLKLTKWLNAIYIYIYIYIYMRYIHIYMRYIYIYIYITSYKYIQINQIK